jgi:hypothetical protein
MRERALFFSLMFLMLTTAAGCHDDQTAVEQCASGATIVDGLPCCGAIALGQVSSACQPSDQCIVEPSVSCICDGSRWVCGDPPLRHDMSVHIPPAQDATTLD